MSTLEEIVMKRKHLTVAAALTLVAGLVMPAGSMAESSLWVDWILTPDTDRIHPQEKIFALTVPEDLTVSTCAFSYRHRRSNETTGGFSYVALKAKGSVTASLEILRGEETIDLGTKKIKVKASDRGPDRNVGRYWADTSDIVDDYCSAFFCSLPVDFPGSTSSDFPLQLEEGDVLLLSLKFKKAPKLLGVEREGQLMRTDGVSVALGCKTCGTNDHPCPER